MSEEDTLCNRIQPKPCNHPRYDHIDWRKLDPTDTRTSCRIVGCECESFEVSYFAREYDPHFE